MTIRPLITRLTPYLTAYLLLVSVGLPLNRVYCACVGEAWLTVLPEEHECHHDEVAASVHHHIGAADACHDHGIEVKDGCKSHDCGDSEAVFEQLDAEFFVDWNLELPASQTVPGVAFWPAEFSARPTAIITDAPIRGPTPPPLPYGRGLLSRIQTFLI